MMNENPAVGSGAHVFTVDVEEYFQVHAFAQHVPKHQWEELPSRVESNIAELLELLAERDVHATFFVLGWIADRSPAVVRLIADAGHEVASHGWSHRRLTDMSRIEVYEELRSSKRVLEDLTGQRVSGFRAPGFSLTPGMEWVFDALLEEGYVYDSSLFPIKRPAYGYPGIPDTPHLISRDAGTVLELPLATWNWQGVRLPAGGGGYFRQFPYEVTRRAIQQSEALGVPATFYLHNWEIDSDQPRLEVPLLSRIRHYRGLSKVRTRLQMLLSEFRFTSVARRFELTEDGLSGQALTSVLSS